MKEAIVRYLEQEEYNEALNHETLARWQGEFGQGKVISHNAVLNGLIHGKQMTRVLSQNRT